LFLKLAVTFAFEGMGGDEFGARLNIAGQHWSAAQEHVLSR
jgi:hypothetical protein